MGFFWVVVGFAWAFALGFFGVFWLAVVFWASWVGFSLCSWAFVWGFTSGFFFGLFRAVFLGFWRCLVFVYLGCAPPLY
jgi:hypothetical protein